MRYKPAALQRMYERRQRIRISLWSRVARIEQRNVYSRLGIVSVVDATELRRIPVEHPTDDIAQIPEVSGMTRRLRMALRKMIAAEARRGYRSYRELPYPPQRLF
jgi:hypothetical protein